MAEAQGNPSRYKFTGKTPFRFRITMPDGVIVMHRVKLLMKSTRELEEAVCGVEVHLYTNGSIVYGNKSFVKIAYHQYAVDTKWELTSWDLSGNPEADLPTFIRSIQDTDALTNPNGEFSLFFGEHGDGKLKLVASFSFDGQEPGKRIRQRLAVKATWIHEELIPIRGRNPKRARMSPEERATALKTDFWDC